MLLKKHIAASGIAEVVIALSIIAMCFTVASLVFIRSTSAPMRFQDVKLQTEIQSQVMKNLFLNAEEPATDDYTLSKETDEASDSLDICVFTGSDQRILWQQQWWKE